MNHVIRIADSGILANVSLQTKEDEVVCDITFDPHRRPHQFTRQGAFKREFEPDRPQTRVSIQLVFSVEESHAIMMSLDAATRQAAYNRRVEENRPPQ